jgi:hypothetical protein
MQESLKAALIDAGIDTDTVSRFLDSGYFLRNWGDPFSGRTWTSVSDFMYGNKGQSSNFEIEKFIAHLKGEYTFDPLPAFQRYTVKSVEEIRLILAESCRADLMREGRLSFRGQVREHTFKRSIPNPVRANAEGEEISVMPGLYRQGSNYSFAEPVFERRSLSKIIPLLAPDNPELWADAPFAYDPMRVEQHYASQTPGLDLSFDILTPLFFATHRFERNANGHAYYRPVAKGEHRGVVYAFCFRDPPVRESQYLIQDFDLFKTYPPERILRQHCGMPLIAPDERNIALTDIDCIFDLHPDFDNESPLRAEWLFPRATEDAFYRRLLEVKERFPKLLPDVVEYEWARLVSDSKHT